MLADWLLRLFTLKSRRFNVAPRVARLEAIVLRASSICLTAFKEFSLVASVSATFTSLAAAKIAVALVSSLAPSNLVNALEIASASSLLKEDEILSNSSLAAVTSVSLSVASGDSNFAIAFLKAVRSTGVVGVALSAAIEMSLIPNFQELQPLILRQFVDLYCLNLEFGY